MSLGRGIRDSFSTIKTSSILYCHRKDSIFSRSAEQTTFLHLGLVSTWFVSYHRNGSTSIHYPL